MYKNNQLTTDHLRNNAPIYFFMIVLFLIGIIFGAVIVNSMNVVQKLDLFFYVDRFFGQLLEGPIVDKKEMVSSTFFYHFNYLLLLFVLGLSIIGLPIIWILLFLKGVVVGFSVGFFVNQMGWQGLLLAAASIAPQNLLIIPVYVVAGSLAMIFSLSLLRKLFSRRMQQPILQPFGRYISLYILLIVLVGIASIIETFISNETMQLVIQWIYT
ncbi:stage II sporulation protein M [Aquibacillus koreensis]|uniref:Stage II sporulation protein M n=1 Tax=Aquibacillus koreensis TaxID=279446 RepID=A0A9X4AI12_9BACI|nr:stage II sporulation protein M [Aquibacillus koreensis]MCT2537454.1 stage II sporulation protein M [Aquibacillus koreensis]MDC3418900.1 stage II sporulation protein M [Aquibacillus koreensis]